MPNAVSITPKPGPERVTTIRQFLSQIYAIESLDISNVYEATLDVPCTVGMCINDDSTLYVMCGGNALIGFYFNDPVRRPVYLIHDNFEEQFWIRQRYRGEEIGPCPRVKLRLVQTA